MEEETECSSLNGEDTFGRDSTYADMDQLSRKPLIQSLVNKQFQEKVRPRIDLIDSLRSLGVEKELALPAIAVIGDQSSGKSSVLEALSGVTLPRGTGIVTRCPLELRLKKSAPDIPWSGTISYRDDSIPLEDPLTVEREVRKAQDILAGPEKGISDELITLEIVSPNVPDLTLIDLPGIIRTALPNQPKDIGNQTKEIIRKYISRKETINLAVVPCNVDIATTEVLEMAREVDPNGERTIGVLTKPDLIDNGAEREVLRVVQNQVVFLNKGYMMVKCRGQREIENNISVEDAVSNERNFFENNEHFSSLLENGQATISHLAERLTKELVHHISKTVPSINEKIRNKLREAQENLSKIGSGVPETEDDKAQFLITKINGFDDGIRKVVDGDKEGDSEELKLFRNLRKLFDTWETEIKEACKTYVNELKGRSEFSENEYRGRELKEFINYRKFENKLREQILKFEKSAIGLLYDVTELIQKCFTDVASKCFDQFDNLHETALNKIEDISLKEKNGAEEQIKLQFKMEKIIHCQDTMYMKELTAMRDAERNGTDPYNERKASEMEAYFEITTNRLANQVPLIIQHYILFMFREDLRHQMIRLLDERKSNSLLEEKESLTGERLRLKNKIERLKNAREQLEKLS